MTEYYISRAPNAIDVFRVAKFTGHVEPDIVYAVEMKRVMMKDKGDAPYPVPEMHCDCPNRRRGKHINDKHGQMVAKWLVDGQPTGYFDEKGKFHEQRDEGQRADFERGVYERTLAGEEWDNEHASERDGLSTDHYPDDDEGDKEHD